MTLEFLLGLAYRSFPQAWRNEHDMIDFYCDSVHALNGFGIGMASHAFRLQFYMLIRF
jgi:hypothetical protein